MTTTHPLVHILENEKTISFENACILAELLLPVKETDREIVVLEKHIRMALAEHLPDLDTQENTYKQEDETFERIMQIPEERIRWRIMAGHQYCQEPKHLKKLADKIGLTDMGDAAHFVDQAEYFALDDRIEEPAKRGLSLKDVSRHVSQGYIPKLSMDYTYAFIENLADVGFQHGANFLIIRGLKFFDTDYLIKDTLSEQRVTNQGDNPIIRKEHHRLKNHHKKLDKELYQKADALSTDPYQRAKWMMLGVIDCCNRDEEFLEIIAKNTSTEVDEVRGLMDNMMHFAFNDRIAMQEEPLFVQNYIGDHKPKNKKPPFGGFDMV